MKKFLMVNKFDLEKDDVQLAMEFHNNSKEALPEGVKSIFVPKEWVITVINDKCIKIDMTTAIDLDVSQNFFKKVREDVGEDMTILTYLGESEFL